MIDEGLGDRQREVYSARPPQLRDDHGRRGARDSTCSTFKARSAVCSTSSRRAPTGNVLLQKLDAFDNYLMSHSTNVCYLSLLLGMKLERYLIDERHVQDRPATPRTCSSLAWAACLHDVGKMQIPPRFSTSPASSRPRKWRSCKLHPTYGYRDGQGARAGRRGAGRAQSSPALSTAAGIPRASTAARARAAAARRASRFRSSAGSPRCVDVYDAATTQPRATQPAKPPVQVLHEMRTFCQAFFDPADRAGVSTKSFRRFPIGQVVTLSNGVEAVVVDFNPKHPVRPKVQGLRDPLRCAVPDSSLEEIDLAAPRRPGDRLRRRS